MSPAPLTRPCNLGVIWCPTTAHSVDFLVAHEHERDCVEELVSNSFLLLVVWPGAPSSVLAPSSDARSRLLVLLHFLGSLRSLVVEKWTMQMMLSCCPIEQQKTVTRWNCCWRHIEVTMFATSNKCHATRNKCLTSSNKKNLIRIVITSFLLLPVRHLLLLAWHL